MGKPGSLATTHGDRPGLPRGRTSLPRDAVRSAQRERLIRALIASIAERGYAEVTIADIARRARVSRGAFYDHFPDKQAGFIAANEAGAEVMFASITATTRAQPPCTPAPERLRAALGAYLAFLAREPEFARTFLIDVYAAGPAALERLMATQERFAANTRTWHRRARREHPDWPVVPADAYLALVGALHQLVIARVRTHRTAELPQLEDTALRLHLAVLTAWPDDR